MLTKPIQQLIVEGTLPDIVRSEDVEHAANYEVAPLLLATATELGIEIPASDVGLLTALSMKSENRSTQALKSVAFLADAAEKTGCDVAVFKGPANAATLYDDIAKRPFGDVDIAIGLSGSRGVLDFLIEIGQPKRSAQALVALLDSGAPVHEVSVPVLGVDIDVHFNPFGMISPVRAPELLFDNLQKEIPLGGRQVMIPTPELALLISLVNLMRKGGGALWIVADAVRLAEGKAGELNWAKFEEIGCAEGLLPIAAQGLRLLKEDLQIDVPENLTAERRWWGPLLGEGAATKGLLRRGTFSILHRSPVAPVESLGALRRWYLPSERALQARGTSTFEYIGSAVGSLTTAARRLRK